MKIRSLARAAIVISGLLLTAAIPARAQYRVTQDLSALSGLATFTFNFQLSDGSQSGNNTSRADIFNLALTGGSLGAVLPPTTGDATGDLSTTLTLRDSDAATNGLADFAQAFQITGAGGSVVFDLDLSASAFDAPIPDGFFLFILDGTQTPLPTTGPTGTEFIVNEFVGVASVPVGFSSQIGGMPFLPAPVITLRPTGSAAIPEPGTLVLLMAGGVVALERLRRRRRTIL